LRINRRATNPDGTKVDKRTSHRFAVLVPVEVSWRGPDGKAIKADAVARQVNARGGFLEMETLPEFGSRISLTNFLSAQTVEARVLATPQTRAGVSNGVAVELVVPNEEFWGVDLQAKKTAVELRKLETALGSQGVDLRLLSEFRDAVEYIRGATSVAQHLREVQLRGRDDNDLHSEIAAERVRRATKLCREIAADLDSATAKPDSRISKSAKPDDNSAAPNSAALDELRLAIAQVSDRLKRLEPRPDPRPVSRPASGGAVLPRNLVSRS
jgi:hypothetical protein